MVIRISTLKTKALNVKKKLNFSELPAFKTHFSFTSSMSVGVSDWARTLSHTRADPKLGWLVGVKDLRLSWNSRQHFHHSACPPPPRRACSVLPLSSTGYGQPGAWHQEELVGPQPWLVAPWGWCHEDIVCEKSLEGDAGPRLPCRAAEAEQRGTRRCGASFPSSFPPYLLLIEPITWL